MFFFFFFKQKTAYEMRISDWSSDVCSSDLNQVSTQQLADWLDATLQVRRFKDYCPNGLQVEGKATISHIITGVTATQALLEAAIERNADAILIHHGWFWKNEDQIGRAHV